MKKWRGIILLLVIFLLLGGLPLFINAVSKGAFVFSVTKDYLSDDESIAAEIEPAILLINFKDEPVWDEKWQEMARVAFGAIPTNLKNLISKKKPLKIVLKKVIGGKTLAYYDAAANTITMGWEEFENPSLSWQEKREKTLGTLLHEDGHVFDAHLVRGKLVIDKEGWLSQIRWKNFLDANPEIRENLKATYEPKDPNDSKRDFLTESFADSFKYYIAWGAFSRSPYSFFREENKDLLIVFSWMKENVFRGKETNRELLRQFLNK